MFLFFYFVIPSIQSYISKRINFGLIKSKFKDLEIIVKTFEHCTPLTKLVAIQAYLEHSVPLEVFLWSFTLNDCLQYPDLSISFQLHLLNKSQFCVNLHKKEIIGNKIPYPPEECLEYLQVAGLEIKKGQGNLLLQLETSSMITFLHEKKKSWISAENSTPSLCQPLTQYGMNDFTRLNLPDCEFPTRHLDFFFQWYHPYDKKAFVPVLVYDYRLIEDEFYYYGIGISDNRFGIFLGGKIECATPKIFFVTKRLNWSRKDIKRKIELPEHGEEHIGLYNLKVNYEIYEP